MAYENKKRKHYTISTKSIDYILEVKKNRICKSESEALEFVLKEHKEKSDTTTELMIKIIAKEVAKSLKYDIEKMNRGINYSDKNIQVIIEMLNGLFIKNNVGDILGTDILKAEGLEIAEKTVKKRLVKSRVRKLDNE
ncbi:hypothetical protein [Clostridium sp. LP20]|uniref:hypothetical protein n=1 Tax=Clostridium sp. LP20 TaxID=3418665 RepID=UPI003EE478EA